MHTGVDLVYVGLRHGWSEVRFVDVYRVLSTPDGRYADTLPGPNGQPEKIRSDDGVHLTDAGARRFAGAVVDRLDADWRPRVRVDVGVSTTTALLDDLRGRVKAEAIVTPQALVEALKDDLKKQLTQADPSLRFEPGAPNVWLFVGVNGVGKTTTIGKVALQQAAAGRSVVMAAGDTFRAAAGEQLEIWAERVGPDSVQGSGGGDPGEALFA